MSKWREINFGFSKGMNTNSINPGLDSAKRILNLQNHIKPGALVLRPGYEELYAAPTCTILDNQGDPVLTNLGVINFDFFFDRQADANGKEIICLIQKAILQGFSDAEDIQNMLCFWVRPYWDGEGWVDEWQWLNKTIITKIATGSDATYPNMIIVGGNGLNGIVDDSLNRFTIYNQTKDEYAKVITSKVSGGYTRICHTMYNSSWDVDDVVIIGNNWLGTNYLNELYNVDWKDISFHKILNDLRIGFGGYEDRPGLTVGYRKNYFQLRSFDFPTKHTDILEGGVLEDFSKLDEIVLDTHILNKTYGLDLTAIEGGELEAGEKTIRLTGITNGFEEQLLAEGTILLTEDSTVEILPLANMGQINPLITGYGIYYSSDGITFYKIFKYNLKEDVYSPGNWKIDANGRLILIKALESTESEVLELHIEENAVSASDINSAGSWDVFGGGTLTIDTDAHDNYSFKYIPDLLASPDPTKRSGIIFPLSSVTKKKYYSISAYAKSSSINKLYSFFLGASLKLPDRTQTEIIVTNEYVKTDFEVYADNLSEVPAYLAIGLYPGTDIYLSVGGGGVYRSSDGLSWLLANSGLPAISDSYYIVNLDTSVLATASSGGSIYRSINSGASWTEISGTSGASAIGIITGSILAACDDGRILRSDDDGESFSQVYDLDTPLGAIDIANISTNIFVGIVGSGVYRSVDNGENWTAVNTGLTSLKIAALYANETYLFAGTEDGGIFRSADNGDSWTDISAGIENFYVVAIVETEDYIFIATYDNDNEEESGIFRSADNGDSWTEANTGLSTLDIGDLFVFGSIVLAGATNGKLFKSIDDGLNWSEVVQLADFIYFQNNKRTPPELFIDLISIKEKNSTVFSGLDEISTEMTAELGYSPTYDLVKGWDQTLSFRGRTYYLNPYVDKRYENFILVSHIHSNGSFMYDLASFSNYRELEKFDSNKTIGMALLTTLDILILKDSSYTILSDDGTSGVLREPVLGISCISRNSIVNTGGIIRWCGGEDVYVLDLNQGLVTKPILKETIRDLYLALSDKSSIQCVRDKHNAYRLRTYKPELKTEYVLSENGWVEEKKWHFPEIYRAGFNNKLYFLSLGTIYSEIIQLDYSVVEGLIMTGEFVQPD
jgi:hypothetical protein